MRIVDDDLTHPHVIDLLAFHMAGMRASSPACSVHALEVARLRGPDVAFWTAWDGDAVMGCAALREIDAGHGEIKSMRTAPAHLRKGVARALMVHLLGVARDRGYTRLGLETGSGPAFEPALALYRGFGFVDGEAFGDYRPDPFLRFMHLDL
jgi:putative acetyltransferase